MDSALSARGLRAGALTGLLLMLSACSQSQMRDGFAEMHGTITMDEKPLVDAQVEIEGQNGRSYGRTDEQGRYEVLYSESLKGAPIGKAIIRISTGVVFRDSRPGTYKISRDGEPYREETVPAKYNKKSELEVTITEGGSPYDFALSSR